jgi:hypothetical protein
MGTGTGSRVRGPARRELQAIEPEWPVIAAELADVGDESARRPGRASHLGASHPLAGVAVRLCAAHLGAARSTGASRIACGRCWERVIRDDERFVVEWDLPRELGPNEAIVDDVAVSRACSGEQVPLNWRELVEAVRRLRALGLPPTQIGVRLHRNRHVIARALARLDAGALSGEGPCWGEAA